MAEFLDPNQAVKEEVKPKENTPVEDQIIRNIDERLKQANIATRDDRQRWIGNYKFIVKGDQWDIRRPPYRFKEVYNITWSNIMTEVGLETDTLPKFDVVPNEASDTQFADILNEINSSNWAKPINQGFGWQDKIVHIDFQRKWADVAHAHIGWDPELENGLGDVSWTVLDPTRCFWDPVAKDISKARWFTYIEPTPLSVLQAKYPDLSFQSDFKAVGDSTTKVDDHNIDLNFGNSGALNILSQGPIGGSNQPYGNEPMVLVKKHWMKDESTYQVELEHPEKPGEKLYELRKHYPLGRYIEVANKHILDDQGKVDEETGMPYVNSNNPQIFRDGLLPITTLKNYDYGDYQGQNEVDHQKGPQKTHNYVVSYGLDLMKAGCNPQKIISERAQAIKNKLTNEPNAVYVVPEVSDIKFESGPGINPSIFNMLDVITGLHAKVSGQSDAAAYGIPNPDINSGDQLDSFTTIAQTRTRLKARALGAYLTQSGLLTFSRYLEFYRDKRVFRVTNKEGFPEYIEFYISKNEAGQDQANVTKTSFEHETELPITGEQKVMNIKGLPDIRISIDSIIPFSKKIQADKAAQAFDRGVITAESYLKAIDWPNYQVEAKRALEEKQAQAAQQGGQ